MVVDCHTHVFGDGTDFPWWEKRAYTPPPASADELLALQNDLRLARVFYSTMGDDRARRATAAALARATRPPPRSTEGDLMEIDRGRQVLFIVRDGRVLWAFNTSTGRLGRATPLGRFTISRQIDGIRVSHLGRLYRPKYFHLGYAVHGYTFVPPYPASAGCVRVRRPTAGSPTWRR